MLQRRFAFNLYICINLVVLLCVSASYIQEYNDARTQTSFAYAIAWKADLLNSTICKKELEIFRDAVNHRILWSLRVLDSSGEFKPGFVYGNDYWLGSRSQCLVTINTTSLKISQTTLNNIVYHDSQKEFPPFQLNYFVAYLKHNSTVRYRINIFEKDMITLGLCLPASCTINNLSFILKRILHDKIILFDDLYSMNFQLIQVKDLNGNNEMLLNSMLRFICLGLGFSSLMIAIGTIYDIFVYQKRIRKNENEVKINETNKNGEKNMSKEMKVNFSSHRGSKIGEILIYFSAYTNTRKIFNTKLNADEIPVIHGLKFLSMCCIIIFHSIYYAIDFMDNKVWTMKFVANHAHLFDIGFMSVDQFFFSSGCLVTYLYLKNKINEKLIKSIDWREKLIEFFIHILKRFIRLTPTYMIVLGISQLSSAWFDKTSQFYMYERSHETCAKYWWRNLLYINNFFGVDTMCMSWSWYLANDMQFYIITVMLLILSTIYFYAAVMILSALLIGSIVLSGYISYVYKYVPTFDELNRLIDVLYHPPWMRIHPYIIGIVAGYILAKLKNNLVLKKKIVIFCWCLAIACYIFILFAVYDRYISVLATSIYIAFHKIFWAIATAWIVIACSTKHGGVINQFLSFKGWIPLSRLTYGAYLLNPIIIRSICSYSETPFHFELLHWIVINIGYITISFFCSYVLSLMVEMPCISVMKIFIQYCKRMHRKQKET